MVEKASKKKWSSQRDAFQESLNYMTGRRRGDIKSLLTPWPKFNDAGTEGIEWGTTVVIGGRPGSGKTLIKDQIVRESFSLNPGQNFRILEFQLEMLARTSVLREFSSQVGRSYKYLCSAEGRVSNEDLQKCYDYANHRVKYPIDVVEEPCTVSEFMSIIKDYMEEYKNEDKSYRNTLITLDHTILLKNHPYRDKQDMLYALGEAVTFLKKRYPIAFIILSQLNRNIDNPERNEDGKYGNYVLESDFFGADAMLQHADIQIGLNRPAKQKIRFYGPDRYIINDEKTLAMHFIKCRNGDTRMSFFNAEFAKMQITEMAEPPTATRGVRVK